MTTIQTILVGIFSSIVAALISTLFTTFYLHYTERTLPVIFASDDQYGRAYPGIIFDRVEDGYTIEFTPPNLQDLLVCEFALTKAASWWELSIEYLQKYPDCVHVRQISETSLEILPNNTPGSRLTTRNGSFFCHCSEQLINMTLDY